MINRKMRAAPEACVRKFQTDILGHYVQDADMSDPHSVPQRLKALRKETGLSIRAMAKELGVSASSYGHYESELRFKDTYLNLEKAQRFAEVLSRHGIDAARVLALAGTDGPTRVEGVDATASVGTLVPVFDVHASAGHGALVEHEEETYSLAFPPNYLSKITTSSPKNLAVIGVKGESMEPTIPDDSIVLLDVSKTDLSWDGLFVLRFDNALHVKRVTRSPRPGHVMILSDNDKVYPPMECRASEVKVIGKVLWYGRKV